MASETSPCHLKCFPILIISLAIVTCNINATSGGNSLNRVSALGNDVANITSDHSGLNRIFI